MTISQAQRSRGLDLDSGSIIERIRKFLPLLVPVFISTIRSTNIFGMALESQGLWRARERTSYLQMEMRTLDWIVLAVALVYVVASIDLSAWPATA